MALTLEQGQIIAERVLRDQVGASEFWRRYQFEQAALFRETSAFWVFLLPSEQLIEESHVPGGLITYVDKGDGRIWSREEAEQYYEAQAARRQPEPQPTCAA
jgi:hypothetical protein